VEAPQIWTSHMSAGRLFFLVFIRFVFFIYLVSFN